MEGLKESSVHLVKPEVTALVIVCGCALYFKGMLVSCSVNTVKILKAMILHYVCVHQPHRPICMLFTVTQLAHVRENCCPGIYIQHNCKFTAGNFQELSKMYKAKAQERVAVQTAKKDPPKMMMVCIRL